VNWDDVIILDASETSATFFIKFPGLYLTYDHLGKLVETQTRTQRKLAKQPLARPGQQGKLAQDGEMGN
jgi:hypothetical protein